MESLCLGGSEDTHLYALLGLRGGLRAGASRNHWLCRETLTADSALPAILSLELRALPTDDLPDRGDL